jgi:hypothetical protein
MLNTYQNNININYISNERVADARVQEETVNMHNKNVETPGTVQHKLSGETTVRDVQSRDELQGHQRHSESIE